MNFHLQTGGAAKELESKWAQFTLQVATVYSMHRKIQKFFWGVYNSPNSYTKEFEERGYHRR